MVARRMRRRGWIKGGTTSPATLDARPSHQTFSERSRGASTVTEMQANDAQAYVFDIEGTLIDTALPALNLWRETLAEFGFNFTTADLHRLSGMSRREVLARLLVAEEDREVSDFVLNKFRIRYRNELLPSLRALPGARSLLAKLKRRGVKVALATASDSEELAQYRDLLKADDCVDVFVCQTDDAATELDRLATALRQLGMARPDEAIYVGDTPYDAAVASAAQTRSFGLLSGHFARADLLDAGCIAVFLDPQGLSDAIIDEDEPTRKAA